MADALTLENMSPELLEVVERAQREPEGRFRSLAHLVDVPALERAFHRLRKDAAVGVDGVTKEEYAKELDSNLADLYGRLKSKRYRHQALRRVRQVDARLPQRGRLPHRSHRRDPRCDQRVGRPVPHPRRERDPRPLLSP